MLQQPFTRIGHRNKRKLVIQEIYEDGNPGVCVCVCVCVYVDVCLRK